MNRLLQWWRAVRLFAVLWPLARREEPIWEEEDRAAFARFLQGRTGAKLLEILYHREQMINAAAVQRRGAHEFHAGYACGFRAGYAGVLSLSAILTPDIEEHPDLSPKGTEELIESYAP